ncbi:MAG: hypothetical protein JNL38_06170 [Myxococcales bacterium]|nr:hypothetical protein [Myxococcales bacterium]
MPSPRQPLARRVLKKASAFALFLPLAIGAIGVLTCVEGCVVERTDPQVTPEPVKRPSGPGSTSAPPDDRNYDDGYDDGYGDGYGP